MPDQYTAYETESALGLPAQINNVCEQSFPRPALDFSAIHRPERTIRSGNG